MSAVNLASAPITRPGDDFYKLNQIDSPALPTGNNTHLSDSMLKRMKIDEWASINRNTPSLKLDLLAAIIDVEDEAIIKALLVCLQAKGALQ